MLHTAVGFTSFLPTLVTVQHLRSSASFWKFPLWLGSIAQKKNTETLLLVNTSGVLTTPGGHVPARNLRVVWTQLCSSS